MPAFILALLPLFFSAVRLFMMANMIAFVLRLAVGLGLSFFVIEPIADDLLNLLLMKIDGLPGDVAAWIGYLNIDRYLSLVISAYAIQITTNFFARLSPV